MNSALSWFTRDISNLEDIYKMIAIIISCPSNMIFLILVHYFDFIENKREITSIDEDLYPSLIALEHEWLKAESQRDFFPRKTAVFIGVAVGGAVLAIMIYKMFKNDK